MKIFFPAFLVFAILFNSCKKGEGDALVSLKSRKAMLAGEWRLTKGTIKFDFLDLQNGKQFSAMYKIDGTSLTGTEYTFTTLRNVQDLYLLNLDFSKDGKLTIKEIAGGEKLDAKGTWDFTNGVGKEKKKESLMMRIEHVSSSSTYMHIFNQFGSTFRYKIKELKNKSLVLTCSEAIGMNANGAKDKISAELIFVK